jgi:hypothetical protein
MEIILKNKEKNKNRIISVWGILIAMCDNTGMSFSNM